MALIEFNQLILYLLLPVVGAMKDPSTLVILLCFWRKSPGKLVTQGSLILTDLSSSCFGTFILIYELVVEPAAECPMEIVGVTNLFSILLFLAV